MKIGIVGTGFVGASAAFALTLQGVGRHIVLVDLDRKRADAEADDILHAVPVAEPLRVTGGDYEDLVGAKVVIIGAGVGQKPGETRLQLLARNARVFADVVPAVVRHAPDAILIVATNPVDVMTHIAARIAAEHGVPTSRVFGSGTMLDSARFRALLSSQLGVDARHVHAYVLGEHGDSEVLAYLTKNVLLDRRALVTVCTPQEEVAGVEDVTVSMPYVLGGEGIVGAHHPIALDEGEQAALHRSASLIQGLIRDLEEETDTKSNS